MEENLFNELTLRKINFLKLFLRYNFMRGVGGLDKCHKMLLMI